MPTPSERRDQTPDPLANPLVSGLLFGGVFLLVLLWKCGVALLSGSPLSAFRDPELSRVLWVLVVFAGTSGLAVAFLRGRLLRRSTMRRKNLATGLTVAACYAGCCTFFFGGDMPPLAQAGLAAFVFAGVAWAVTSAMNEVFG